MNLAAQRRVSVIALAVTAVLLSACSPASNSAATPSASTSKPSKTPDSTPSSSPTVEPAEEDLVDLAFGNTEDSVKPEWQIGWADPFAVDEGFAVLAADDGAGSWSYTETATACEIHFYQGQIFDLDYTQDDRAASDQMLATLATGTPTPEDIASIAASAGDFAFGTEPGEGAVEARIIGGTFPDGRTIVQATRMFGTRGGGITVSLACPAGVDASNEFGRLAESHLRVVVAE
ncbi:hypothetical protein [Microbacterium sp. CFBP9034]|uniref:hypothetical protein n=1 Tax=Microbacterium sp. CFBP9034 TaxID=3096540 RepID=UPI002A6B2875|nr:hypothetical protein [Microbacterium sp. CFBP9034]MDY0909476.1 hypothetical protein [Microbacterium sp. CFBP9034]